MKTKTALKLSLTLNLAVLASLAWFVAAGRLSTFASRRYSSVPPSTDASGLPTSKPTAPMPTAVQAGPNLFQWNQLESPDYRVYVANLRAIGCPELTIRDIIAADVDGLYSEKRQALHLGETATGRWSRQEERQFVASLLGGRIETESSPAFVNTSEPRSKPVPTPLMPLVFRAVDLDRLHLNDGQKEAIAALQQEFVTQIGGSNEDPSDPAYRERWQQAQPEIDDMLRGMIGASAFMDFQLEAANGSPNDRAAVP